MLVPSTVMGWADISCLNSGDIILNKYIKGWADISCLNSTTGTIQIYQKLGRHMSEQQRHHYKHIYLGLGRHLMSEQHNRY